MFERAPTVDFPKHRPKQGLRRVEPVAQRPHRTDSSIGDASDDNLGPPALFLACSLSGSACADGKLSRYCSEPDMLNIEADQRGATKTEGGQQEQGAVAHPGEIT